MKKWKRKAENNNVGILIVFKLDLLKTVKQYIAVSGGTKDTFQAYSYGLKGVLNTSATAYLS